MELRHLRYFVAVAEDLHFGRAAKRLHIVQPALSKQIAALERELGVTLFSRTKHRTAFTPAGEAFFEEALDILRRVDHATRTARMTESGAVGSLDIGFIAPAMWSILPGLLREHRRRHPGVRFVLQELPTEAQVRRLKDGELDAAFVTPFGPDELISFTTVWREPFVVGLPEGHRLARESVVDLADCAAETFVLVSRVRSPGFFDQCLRLCQSHGFSPEIIEEGNSPGARCGMVSAGIGVTLAQECISRGFWPGVVFRPLINSVVQAELGFAHRRSDMSATVVSLLQTLEQVVEGVEMTSEAAPAPAVTPRLAAGRALDASVADEPSVAGSGGRRRAV
jgi:DNA-binding transcriptional LysR family regulator